MKISEKELNRIISEAIISEITTTAKERDDIDTVSKMGKAGRKIGGAFGKKGANVGGKIGRALGKATIEPMEKETSDSKNPFKIGNGKKGDRWNVKESRKINEKILDEAIKRAIKKVLG